MCPNKVKSNTISDNYSYGKVLCNNTSAASQSAEYSIFSKVRELTLGNNYYLEINPSKITKDDFSLKNISGFYTEKLRKIPVISLAIPFIRLFAKLISSNNKDINTISPKEAAYIKFCHELTYKATGQGEDQLKEVLNQSYERVFWEDLFENKPIPDGLFNFSKHSNEDRFSDNHDGFDVFVQRSKKAKKIVISYKDTDDFKDLKSCYQVATGKKPEQLEQAMAVYKAIAEKYPDYEIIVTGYSLGGSFAELVCSSKEAKQHGNTKGYSFNGYGVADNLSDCGKDFKDNGNVTCISSCRDFICNSSYHIGKEYYVPHNYKPIYITEADKKNIPIYGRILLYPLILLALPLAPHLLDSMEDTVNKLKIDNNLYDCLYS